MKYDLYFHNDMDGVASAAVMLDYIAGKGDSVGRFAALDYLVIPEWKRENFFERNSCCGPGENPAIVLDFPYHPKAALWFDHHPSTFKRPEWEKNFTPDKFHHLDETRLSCARFVMDVLEKEFGYRPPRRIRELARWLDVIDSARYVSARQTIALREPALQLTAVVESQRTKDHSMKRFVELLAGKSIREALKDKAVSKIFKGVKRDTARALAFYRSRSRLLGKTVFTDETGIYAPTLRFAPAYFYPAANFTVRMRQDKVMKQWYHLSVGVNPWNAPRKFPHLGKLLGHLGGGGHEKIGGLEVRGLKKAAAARDKIISMLDSLSR